MNAVAAQSTASPLLPFNVADKRLTLFIFLSPECPLCRNYTKPLNELSNKYKNEMQVYGIIPGTAYSSDDINAFRNKYKIQYDLITDSIMSISKYFLATTTPEAVLVDNAGGTVYRGAIDNWVETLGKKKLAATRFYLHDAVDQYLSSNMIILSRTKPVGCKINDF